MAANKIIRNIRPEEPDPIGWDYTNATASLQKIRNIVEVEGQKAIDWYWKAKRWKRIPSQSIQFFALLLTAAAGLVPIIIQLVKNAGANWAKGLGHFSLIVRRHRRGVTRPRQGVRLLKRMDALRIDRHLHDEAAAGIPDGLACAIGGCGRSAE
jgi:hypothetical protein